MRLRTLIVALLLALTSAGAALALHRITLHNTKTFTLAAGKTQTFKVAYPDALKYGGSTYSGKTQILPPAKNGAEPTLTKVRVRTRGSVAGGSAFAVKVHNGNPAGTAAVRVRVTATTVLPPETNP
jgi:hypothetical protein